MCRVSKFLRGSGSFCEAARKTQTIRRPATSRVGDSVRTGLVSGDTMVTIVGRAEGTSHMSSSGNVILIGLGCGVCLVAVLVIGWALAAYNKLVRQRNQVDAAWAQIDVQLKRRYDLIPNLVETVKGYAAHERGTLDAVVQARNTAVTVAQQGPAARAQAENALTQTLGRLFALAEAYPNLKANENFLGLQSELAGTEDKIAYARQI